MQMPSRNDLMQAALDRQKKSAETSAKSRERDKERGYVHVSLKVPECRRDLLIGFFKEMSSIFDDERNGGRDSRQVVAGVVDLVRDLRVLLEQQVAAQSEDVATGKQATSTPARVTASDEAGSEVSE
ncbi:hypothetical protein [Pseudoroseicyclus tamaricis]|uniref:Uncharacterized protein n=1 Tax=Pseudoroseicyclus tamaricis TaxID=2705421 RepID=A0A6B2JVD2_9RHOB|nr:hypothetical protein [Pseudoroseicyclus tamaricis]NDV00589.1 hypothetical protein [Pseudoroseicyclus tamaricis]